MRASNPTLATHLSTIALLLALPLLCPTAHSQTTPAQTTPAQPNPTPTASPTDATPTQATSPTPAAATPQPPTPATAPIVLTIHMLNAKTGKPMRRYELRAEFQGSPQKLTLTTDKEGFAHLDLPPTATAVSLIAIPRKGHPDQPAYTVCGPFGQFLSIPDLIAHGYVPQNACTDNLHLPPHPAEVYYLIEPLPWYNPATE